MTSFSHHDAIIGRSDGLSASTVYKRLDRSTSTRAFPPWTALHSVLLAVVLLLLVSSSSLTADGAADGCVWLSFARRADLVYNTSTPFLSTRSLARRYFINDAIQHPQISLEVHNLAIADAVTVTVFPSSSLTATTTTLCDPIRCPSGGNISVTATTSMSLSLLTTTSRCAPTNVNAGGAVFNASAPVAVRVSLRHDPVEYLDDSCISSSSPLVALDGDRAAAMVAVVPSGMTSTTATFVSQRSALYAVCDVTDGDPSGCAGSLLMSSEASRALMWFGNTSLRSGRRVVVAPITEYSVSRQPSFALTLPPNSFSSSLIPSQAIGCTISDMQTFDVRVLPQGTPLLSATSGYCYVYGTVSQLHHACQSNPLCIGYTTNFLALGNNNNTNTTASCLDEVPLCLLYEGTVDTDAWAKFDRMLYMAPTLSDRRCTMNISVVSNDTANINTNNNNTTTNNTTVGMVALDIWVTNAAMRNATVDIFVGNAFAASCGGPQYPFLSGDFGVNGACTRTTLCARVMTNISATDAVAFSSPLMVVAQYNLPSPTMVNFGCEETITVFATISMQEDIRARMPPTSDLSLPVVMKPAALSVSAVTPQLRHPRQLLATRLNVQETSVDSTSQWVSMTTEKVSVFVFGASYLFLEVQQGAFDAREGEDNLATVELRGSFFNNSQSSVVVVLQSCGSAQRFALNQQGLSHHCDTYFACGDLINISSSVLGRGQLSNYTGTLDIILSHRALTLGQQRCAGTVVMRLTALRASINSSSSSSASRDDFGFVLGSSSSTFQPLLGISSSVASSIVNLTTTVLSTLFNMPALQRDGLDAFFFSSSGVVKRDVLANEYSLWATLPLNDIDTRAEYLSPNATYGLFMDQLGSGGASFFFIPVIANYIRVRVAQSLVSPGATVRIIFWIGYDILASIDCLQSDEYILQAASCSTFLECRSTFIPSGYDGATVLVVGDVAVNDQCDDAVAVVLEFSQRVAPALPSTNPNSPECPILCPSSYQCITASQLCNGIVECSGGLDEVPCNEWYAVEQGFALYGVINNTLNMTYNSVALRYLELRTASADACKREALYRSLNAFSFHQTNATCRVYHVDASIILDPSSKLVAVPGMDTYVWLPQADRLAYGGCSSVYYCNGRGEATLEGGNMCSCASCSSGYEGARCEVLVSGRNANLFAVTVGSPASAAIAASWYIPATTIEFALRVVLGGNLVNNADTASCEVIGVKRDDPVSSIPHVLYLCDVSGSASTTPMSSASRLLSQLAPNVSSVLSVLHPHETQGFDVSVSRASWLTKSRMTGCTTNYSSSSSSAYDASSRMHCDVALNSTSAAVAAAEARFVKIAVSWSAASTMVMPTSNMSSLFNIRINYSSTLTPTSCEWIEDGSSVAGCVTYVCLLPLRSFLAGSSSGNGSTALLSSVVHVVLDVSWNVSGFADDVCALRLPPAVEVVESASIATLANHNAVKVREEQSALYLPLLIVGFALVGLGGVLCVVGMAMLVIDFLKRRNIKMEAMVESSPITRLLREIFTRLEWYVRDKTRPRYEHWGMIGCVVGYNLVVAGVVGVLVAFLYPPSANYMVSLESYPNAECQRWLSPTPSAMLVLDPTQPCSGSGQSAGVGGFGARSASATCAYDSDGVLWVTWQYADSPASCARVTEPQRAVNGSCVPSPDFFADPFLLVMCGERDAVQYRYDSFRTVARQSEVVVIADSLVVAEPPRNTTPSMFPTAAASSSSTGDAAGGSVFSFPFAKGSSLRRSTSWSGEIVVSTARMSDAAPDEDDGASRLVYQITESSFLENATAVQEAESMMEPFPVTLRGAMDALDFSEVDEEALRPWIPRVDEAPIGYLFQNFNMSTPPTPPRDRWLTRAQRYYNVRHTYQDIGYFFGPSTTDDELGFTISMTIRLESDAEGFPFVLSDALEERLPGGNGVFMTESPIVDRLWDMESQLLSGNDWFEQPYHVYAALYVSAVTKRMHFVMADPVRAKTSILDVAGNSSRYVRAVWDLNALGFGDILFNQEWHQLAIVLKNQNNQVKARLMVDGSTNEALPWTQCISRRPTPIADWGSNTMTSSLHPVRSYAFSRGALYVGLVPGGVSGLRFEAIATNDFTLISRGTPAMRQLHDLQRDKIYGIAVVLFVFACLMTLFTLCGSGYAVSVDRNRVEDEDIAACLDQFLKITKYEVTEEASGETPFPRAGFRLARRWLDLNQAQFALFLSELAECAKYPHRELVRILYLVRAAYRDKVPPDTLRPLPTLKEWQALLAEDQKHPKPAKPDYFWERFLNKDGSNEEGDALYPQEEAARSQRFPTERNFLKRKRKNKQAALRMKAGLGIDEVAEEDEEDEDLGQEAAEANLRAGGNYVDIGGGIGKGRDGMGGIGSSKETAGAGSANSVTAELYNFFLPVISSLQTVYVWLSGVPVPGGYDSTFGQFFASIAIDVAKMVQKIAAYSTPLMQLLAGLIIIGGLYYLCSVDNKMFDWYLARYAYKRDQLEGRTAGQPKKAAKKSSLDDGIGGGGEERATHNENGGVVISDNSKADDVKDNEAFHPVYAYSLVESTFLKNFENPFDDTVSPEVVFEVELLPMLQCQKIDRFAGAFRLGRDDELPTSETLKIHNDEGDMMMLSKAQLPTSIVPKPKGGGQTEEKVAPSHPQQQPAASAAAPDNQTNCIHVPQEQHPQEKLTSSNLAIVADLAQTQTTTKKGKRPPVEEVSVLTDNESALTTAVAFSISNEEKDVDIPPEHHPADALWIAPIAAATASGALDDRHEHDCDLPHHLAARLEVLGCYCRRHRAQRLSPMVQTNVWPFEDPPACCVIMNGKPCGQRTGLIYSCGRYDKTVCGGFSCCDYAVCERHFRGGVKEVLLAKGVGIIRMVRDRGWEWALAVIFVTAGNAAYTPFMKTALMIISCNPYFQCTFACWSNADALFVVAVMLCLVMLGLFGVGVPLIQVALLRFRQRRLAAIFLAEEYGGRYEEKEAPVLKLEHMGPWEFVFGIFTGNSIPPLLEFMRRTTESTSEMLAMSTRGDTNDNDDDDGSKRRRSNESVGDGGEDVEQKSTTVEQEPAVSLSEWSRFLATDPTAMAMLYNTMEHKWMHMTPILLMFKVIVISQVVFLPTGSLAQRTGMAVVEIIFGVVVLVTAPFTSPVVDAMYRLASIHQLFLLALQNMDAVHAMDGSYSLAYIMIGCSGLYLAICVSVVVITSVWPAIKSVRDKVEAQTLLRSLGLQYSGTTNLYINPVLGRGVRVKRRGAGLQQQQQQQQYTHSSLGGHVAPPELASRDAAMLNPLER